VWTHYDGVVFYRDCRASFDPNTLPSALFNDVVDRRNREDFRRERELLLRTQALFDKEHEARRFVKACQYRHSQLSPRGTAEGDGGDDSQSFTLAMRWASWRWTRRDPELRAFLIEHIFSLEHRLEFVDRELRRLEGLRITGPACSRCGRNALDFE
jgi:hypothetical protein